MLICQKIFHLKNTLKIEINGDYKLIEHNEGRSNHVEVISNLQDMLHPIDCDHKKVGCELPFTKRNLSKCTNCYYNK